MKITEGRFALGALTLFAAWLFIGLPMLNISSRHQPTNSQPSKSANQGSIPISPHETPDKLTDWLLVILNVFLVGSTLLLWRANNRSARLAECTLKSTERTIEALERARIFHGYSPMRWRGDRAEFTLRMTNVGRMPGLVTGVYWKFLARTELPPTKDEIDWKWEFIHFDYITKPNQTHDIDPFESLSGAHVFVTYLTYEDLLTRKKHVSWMGMHIDPDKREITQAGGLAWNDWT